MGYPCAGQNSTLGGGSGSGMGVGHSWDGMEMRCGEWDRARTGTHIAPRRLRACAAGGKEKEMLGARGDGWMDGWMEKDEGRASSPAHSLSASTGDTAKRTRFRPSNQIERFCVRVLVRRRNINTVPTTPRPSLPAPPTLTRSTRGRRACVHRRALISRLPPPSSASQPLPSSHAAPRPVLTRTRSAIGYGQWMQWTINGEWGKSVRRADI
ncbi:hypothetical protein B0H11DRAFT_2065976 [Mycena galericulata]|nr:hypothetical protein B0H11DRAFT_2065976 [Mycena galericulata]